MGCGSSVKDTTTNGGDAPDGESSEKGRDWIKKNYIMGKTLGKGGSCRVVICTKVFDEDGKPFPKTKDQKSSGPQYALKIMAKKDNLNKQLYNKEKDILAVLEHPNIIHLHLAVEDPSHYYIFSDLCSGGELFDRIVDKTRVMTEKKASELVRTMLLAIQHCHNKNIVHRDLKPENFVFKDKSEDSEMVLIDFGCAMRVKDDEQYTELVGTPYYLAPESAAGHKYTRTGRILKSSDIWSIGVIAYVLMTGRPPFNGQSNTEIFANIIKKPLKFPPGVKLSASFTTCVKSMLKKSPKQRIKMEDALADPWVTGKESSDKKIDSDVIKVLKQFNQQSKLKKAITKTLAGHMGSEPKEKIKEHFNRLDKDGNGSLDKDELSLLLMDMGISKAMAVEEAEKIIMSVDDDGSKKIEFDEFAQVWQRKLLTVNDSYIHAVFTVLDADGDGQVSAEELAKVIEEDQMDKVKAMIEEVDKDGNGQLSFEEFKLAMKEVIDDASKNNVGQKIDMDELNHATKDHDGQSINLEAMEN